MKFIFVLFFVLFNFSFSIAQEIIIKAANSNGKAALCSLSGEKSSFIDSIPAISNAYQFNLSNNHPGFYRLIFNNKKWLDFVYDNEDIKIETDANYILDSVKVLESKSNKLYYEFIRLSKEYKTKSELLRLVLHEYPREEEYKKLTKQTLAQTQTDYWSFVNIKAQSNKNSFIARYIQSVQLPLINPDIPKHEYLNVLKTYSLNNVNFTDDELIYSDAFTNKAIEYLSYYRNPQLPMGLLEKEFETAVDSLLNKAKVNSLVYKHLTEYLLDGFKKYGFDNVINYIVENYVIKDDICLDEKLETALDRRINQSKYFKIGDSVPDIVLPDLSGGLLELNKIKAEKILIIFYASWCPHCKTLLPQVSELYKRQNVKDIEVAAVSIDTLKTDWQNFITSNKLSWINVCDLKGWDSKAVLDYYIYATPTMFLIDKNRKIIAKPTSVEDVKSFF